jgi:hypothetical protein
MQGRLAAILQSAMGLCLQEQASYISLAPEVKGNGTAFPGERGSPSVLIITDSNQKYTVNAR